MLEGHVRPAGSVFETHSLDKLNLGVGVSDPLPFNLEPKKVLKHYPH